MIFKEHRLKRLIFLSLMTSFAIALSFLDEQIPLPLPVPGIKIGLANVIVMMTLYLDTASGAIWVSLCRVVLCSFLFSSFTGFLYALAGAMLSLIAMAICKKFFLGKTLWITGVFGSLFHVSGQILIAALLLNTLSVLAYYPILIASALITGTLTGICTMFFFKHFSKIIEKSSKTS